MMPTILFLTRALDIGGAQRQLVELALGLHRAGWKVHVLLFYGDGELEPKLREAGIEVQSLHKRGRWDVLGFVRRMVSAIRQARPTIVHGYLDVANILLTVLHPLFRRSRLVWGVRASNVDFSRYDLLARIVFRGGVLSSRMADLIICNSEAGRAYHAARGYDSRRMVTVPNGVDLQQFMPDAAAREAVRAEWGIAPHEKLVGLAARLDPMKDHPNFIEAAARVAEALPDVKFVCVGDGPADYRSRLRDLSSGMGFTERLIWAGARTDMRRVYNAFDLAVSSSAFGEGTSNTMAEAMATGVPCIATDVGDARSLVGSSGWICSAGDSSALAGTIIEALAAPPRDRASIRERMLTEFSSEALVRRTAQHLQALVQSGAHEVRGVQNRHEC